MESDSEQLVLKKTGEQIAESVTRVTGAINITQLTEVEPVRYYLILADCEDLQVTFDNNGDNNYWSFHAGSSDPNVSELFHIEDVGGNKVKIFGYLPPLTRRGQVRWYLTISENRRGVLDKYPKFSAEDGLLVGNENIILHTEFTRHDSPTDLNTFGLSFTTKNDETRFLLPVNRRKRIGWSKTFQYPFLMVPPEDMKLVDLDRAKKKCWKCCIA
jgi:hypothetical protein